MNARVGFDRRLGIERVFHSIALVRNRKDPRVSQRVERIALLLSGQTIPDGEIVNNISADEKRTYDKKCPFQYQSHIWLIHPRNLSLASMDAREGPAVSIASLCHRILQRIGPSVKY